MVRIVQLLVMLIVVTCCYYCYIKPEKVLTLYLYHTSSL